MSVLLLVQEIPESLKLYFIPEVVESEIKVLKKCNGHYINGDAEGITEKCICSVLYALAESKYKKDWLASNSVLSSWKKTDWSMFRIDSDKKIPAISAKDRIHIITTGIVC